MNIEDKRPGRLKPWYDGLPLSVIFRKQENYTVPGKDKGYKSGR